MISVKGTIMPNMTCCEALDVRFDQGTEESRWTRVCDRLFADSLKRTRRIRFEPRSRRWHVFADLSRPELYILLFSASVKNWTNRFLYREP